MFIDYAKIQAQAGKGGDGSMAFRREKYVPNGGPAGGDGGRGGNVVFIADNGENTLLPFRYKRKFKAENGGNGEGANRTGKSGSDLIIKVPVGTVIKDSQSGRVYADLTQHEQKVVLLKGGKGGRGNQHFATSVRQSPHFYETGEAGEEAELILELKVLADVGLLGFPNVGKSTLLSKVTNATPKIADYHFTTIDPNLGVVKYKDAEEFVIADIPGIIEGASDGAGLGHRFLRHIERTKLLLHVLDASGIEGRDAKEDFETINEELQKYSPTLAALRQIVVLNKTDLISEPAQLEALRAYFEQKGYEVFEISAAAGQGLNELIGKTAQYLQEIKEEEVFLPPADESEEVKLITYDKKVEKPFEIDVRDGVFYVTGSLPNNLLKKINFEDSYSAAYFQKVLTKEGVEKELKKLGVKNGDTVVFGEKEFEYFE